MKILQTPVRFYPYIGGVENSVYYLSKELIKLGHKVKVICANEPPIGDGMIEGIQVKRLNYIGKIANTNITLGLPKEILNEDFDIIHTHLPTPWSADWSNIISLIKKRPLILTYHNDIIGRGIYFYIAKLYNTFLLPVLLKLAKKIIVTHKRYIDYSPYLKGYIEKIEVIPLGVSLEEFKPIPRENKEEKIIFFLGILDKFHRYKGLDYLIKALPLIRKKVPNVKLIVGGEGALKEEYKRLVHSLDLDEQVNFIGFVSRENTAKYYSYCDVFVLPSISFEQEGFGMVLLEAMACAKPVVTTNMIGVAEKIKKENIGIVINPKDTNSLAEAIIDIFQKPDYALEMGERAREIVEKEYSWDKIAQEMERLYLGLLK